MNCTKLCFNQLILFKRQTQNNLPFFFKCHAFLSFISLEKLISAGDVRSDHRLIDV